MPKNTVHTGASIEGPDGETEMVGGPTVGAPRIGEGEQGPELVDLPEGTTVESTADEPAKKAPAKKAAAKAASK